jgi:hypothetical protein
MRPCPVPDQLSIRAVSRGFDFVGSAELAQCRGGAKLSDRAFGLSCSCANKAPLSPAFRAADWEAATSPARGAHNCGTASALAGPVSEQNMGPRSGIRLSGHMPHMLVSPTRADCIPWHGARRCLKGTTKAGR